MTKIFRFLRTIRHLKLIQIYFRLISFVYRPSLRYPHSFELRNASHNWKAPAEREVSLFGGGTFKFLNEEGLLGNNWTDPEKNKLWLYNLHYFDDLNAKKNIERKSQHLKLIVNWVEFYKDVRRVGWEPYPTSLRIVNWIKWLFSGNQLPKFAILNLFAQARWLRLNLEWHLLGNHLSSNAKALIFAGLFFSGKEADKWLFLGKRILRKQLNEQVLNDGAHFELSPMYHVIFLEDLLDIYNISLFYEHKELTELIPLYVDKMIHWLKNMSHPDGKISFFNDAAFGVAPENNQIFQYANRLGFKSIIEEKELQVLMHSGYAVLRKSSAVVIVDVGKVGPNYLPGHAHADCLSFEMSINNSRIIVNSGTSTYDNSIERLRQRGTEAHSTLLIDGFNSSEVWSSFRVGRRAKPIFFKATKNKNEIVVGGGHDGYSFIKGSPRHFRNWILQEKKLLIEDCIVGKGKKKVDIFFHIGQHLLVEMLTKRSAKIVDKKNKKSFILKSFNCDLKSRTGTWHPEFGKSISMFSLYTSLNINLPCKINFSIEW